jgi:hypothetical protein
MDMGMHDSLGGWLARAGARVGSGGGKGGHKEGTALHDRFSW